MASGTKPAGAEDGLAADGLGLEGDHPRVDLRGGSARGVVGDHPHALPRGAGAALHAQGDDVVARVRRDRGREVGELAGEVLVDKEDLHGVQAGRCSGGRCACGRARQRRDGVAKSRITAQA